MTHAERWDAVCRDVAKAATTAIDYNSPGKGVKFIEPAKTVGRRKRIVQYELTGRVNGMQATYC